VTGCTDGPKTVDELKEQKENNPSEYDKCLTEVEANEQFYEECISNKLVEAGYTDGIDCIQNFNEDACQDTERYNAEVDANNECYELDPPSSLNLIDCMQLIQN